MKSKRKDYVMYSLRDIHIQTEVLAALISDDPTAQEDLDAILYVCVLDGATYFFSDLTLNLWTGECVYVNASSYGDKQSSSGNVVLNIPEIKDGEKFKRVYIIDDICDTGNTLKVLREEFEKICSNAIINTVVLINRLSVDNVDTKVCSPDYSAFTTESKAFLAGYGMDNKGADRNFPGIYEVPEY